MEIKMIATKDVKPYPNNPRRNKDAVDAVAASIRDFGFKVPVILDTNNVVVCGHTRLLAAKKLRLQHIPCIYADDLSDEQIRAFRLADNKVSELAEWDFDLLDLEIGSIFEFDMADYGFDLQFDSEQEAEHEEQKDLTNERVDDLENVGKAIFPGDGDFDIPQLEAVTEMPDVSEWISFNYVLSDTAPQGKAVHFFVHDYQFTRCWNFPERYVEPLKRYEAVLTPDFSTYTDYLRALQIYNHYKKHWLGAYWQSNGMTVIPTVSWSSRDNFAWCFDGEPRGGIVAVSTVGTQANKETKALFMDGYAEMMERLKPCAVIMGGKVPEECKGNIIPIGAFQDKWADSKLTATEDVI